VIHARVRAGFSASLGCWSNFDSGAAEEGRDIFGVLSSRLHIQDLVASEHLRPLRRLEYERMVAEGFFEDERLELLDGIIIEMTPQGTRHAATIERLTDRLAAALRGRASLRACLSALPDVEIAVSDIVR
jgi:hypothetical protein